MSVPSDQLIRGARYRRRLSATATGAAVVPDWSTTDATFVMDGPNGVRNRYRWIAAGGGSSEVTRTGANLFLFLTSTFTSTMTAGKWTVGVFYGAAATEQDTIGLVRLTVFDLPNGAAPVGA